MKKIILLIIFILILVGCSWNKQPHLSHKIEFIKDTTISYNKKMDSSELIISVDNISINRNNFEGNKLYISNFYVTCPDFPESLGQHHLIYEIGKEKYGLDIEIKDLEAPVIKLKKSNYLLEKGQEFKEKSVKKNSNKSTDKKNENKKPQRSKKGSTVKPVSKHFTVKQYKTLKECERKCIEYIQRCNYSGIASAVPIMKNGIYIGYKAEFN